MEKHGTTHDRANLPQTTAQNQGDKRKWGFTIMKDALPDRKVQMIKVAQARIQQNKERKATFAVGGDEVAVSLFCFSILLFCGYGFLSAAQKNCTPPSLRLVLGWPKTHSTSTSHFLTWTF